MKKYYLITCTVIFMSLAGCSKKDPIGKWEDNIKLSQKNATLQPGVDSITITTAGNSWWINNISLDSTMVPNSFNINTSQPSFVFSTADFVLQRINGISLKIKMNANTGNANRRLLIGMQDGNYFDGIVITQLHWVNE